MKLFVLGEYNTNPEYGEMIQETYGVFSTKEKALKMFENIEYDTWCNEYDDLDYLINLIEDDKKELLESGKCDFFVLSETDYYP